MFSVLLTRTSLLLLGLRVYFVYFYLPIFMNIALDSCSVLWSASGPHFVSSHPDSDC